MKKDWLIDMKIICDANIILRYLIHDDDKLYKNSVKIIKKSPYVPILVMSEVVYVLSGTYKISRAEIVNTLMILSKEVVFEENELFIKTLEYYKDNNLDFVDCYLLARSKMLNEEVSTFDKKLNKVLKK